MRNNNAPDYIVTREEFEEYYNNVSCSIDDDEYFALMMNNAWNLDGSMIHQKGWSNNNSSGAKQSLQQSAGARPQSSAQTKLHATTTPKSESARSVASSQHMRGTPRVSQAQKHSVDFDTCLEKFRNKIKSRGARGIMGIGRLFRIYDDNGNGSIDLEEAKKAFQELRVGITEE